MGFSLQNTTSDLSLLTVKVYIATTWIKLVTNKYAVLPCGVSIVDFIRRKLHECEWNQKIKAMTLVSKYCWYNDADSCVYMPRYAFDDLMVYFEQYGVVVEKVHVNPIQPSKMVANMKPNFQLRPEQIPIVAFLTDKDTGNGFKPLALTTGGGKTASSICAAVKLGYPTLVILQGLIDQWIDSILNFTDVSKDDIYLIKGFDSLKMLWEMVKNGYKPKFLLCSTRTLAMYTTNPKDNYTLIPPFNDLCEVIGIGTKIIDECHLNFNTNCHIDFRCNIKMNIYLSATYQRSSRDGRRIFNMYFPQEFKYGENFIKKYTTAEVCYYHLCIPNQDIGKFKSVHGYSQANYERYIRKRPMYMNLLVNEVIYPIVNRFFSEIAKPGQHCLILVQTRKFAEELFKRLMKKVVNTTMAVFFSGDPGTTGDEANLKKDIIISTIQSCGTGRDIKGLKTCINVVSMASPPQTLQCFGRLRQIPGEDTYYCDLVNEEIYSHKQHSRVRIQLYKPKAKEVVEFTVR